MKVDFSDLIVQIASAASGAAVGLRAVPTSTVIKWITNWLAGFAIAIFGGPALVEQLAVSSLRISAAIIFVLGSTGLVAFDAIIEGIKKTDFASWIAGWLPGKK